MTGPSNPQTTVATSRIGPAWGDAPPDWVVRLAQACDATSQAQVARQLNRSASLVSTVLAGTYRGSMAAVEEVVRGVFMATTVDCPVLGTLPSSKCQDWRRASGTLASHNALRVQMFRACNRCPINTRAAHLPPTPTETMTGEAA